MATIIEESKLFCESILSSSICANYHFHNLKHSLEVYKGVLLIAEEENITSEEKELVSISALFHDTGYSRIYKGHEEVSMEIAENFLKTRNYNEYLLSSVLKCIYATRMPQNPENILEKIICDADLIHLSAPNYLHRIALLRKEWSYFLDMKFTDEEWQTLNIQFLKDHKYHTNFGRSILEKNKMHNLLLLQKSMVPKN